ncbi:MAG TPA: helix-turn-helix transcriptional regulator [Tissierellia bacterium]|nr:helix-turn-helix transcriptional regulator [Tissierellia bacterium]
MDASRIVQKRIERGVSAPDMARRLGVAKSTIYRYESGAIEKMPVGRLIQIAKILETTPAYLMFWTDEDEADESSIKECFEVPRRLTAKERHLISRQLDQFFSLKTTK